MDDYNFWADLLDTYQSTADWVKALWIVSVPAFALGLVALIFQYRIVSKLTPRIAEGDLVYTIHRDDLGRFHVYRHGSDLEQTLDLGKIVRS